MQRQTFRKALLTLAIACAGWFQVLPQNPYLPMWEYIPDGEPYVFDDPDQPGRQRVYIYGSHDMLITGYCGRDLVAWSAPVDDLHEWRYEGVIFDTEGLGDVLYAPDVAECVDASGKKWYYLYPNNQVHKHQTMVARSDRPTGPFRVINWKDSLKRETVGILGFDPAVFVDDDGRVYAYWGFREACMAELDPTTMATVKPGTEIIRCHVNDDKAKGIYRFFEASSMRKIKDKYVFIYSRNTGEGEFGLGVANSTLAYAYGNSPLGPFIYGGTIIDIRGRDLDDFGRPMYTAVPNGNTHGSICEINGQWWVFYHRQTGLDEYSRQAMVAPIEVEVCEGPDGYVRISEGEYNSEGFCIEGLDPFHRYSAGIACYFTGPKPAIHKWPRKIYSGSYVAPVRLDSIPIQQPYALAVNHNPVVNNTDSSVVGYKYFNFSQTYHCQGLQLSMNIVPKGYDATIDIYVNSPYASRGARKIGQLLIDKNMPQVKTELLADVASLAEMSGKKALFFIIRSDVKEQSLCDILDFAFISSNR